MQDQKNIDDHLADQELYDAPDSNAKIGTVEEGMILQLADGSMPVCNHMAERILGLTAEEIHGWNSPESSWRFVHQNGTPLTEVTHPAMVALRTGQPCWNFVVGLDKPNTDLIWLLMNSQPLFLAQETSAYAVVYTFSEITQQQAEGIKRDIVTQDISQNQKLNTAQKTADVEMARQLSENEPKFTKLLDSNIIGIVLADFEKIIEANDIFLQMVGYTREDLLTTGISWRQITPLEYQHLDENALQELLPFGTFTPFEKQYIRKDGSLIPILIGGAILQQSPPNCVCFVMDLSDRQKTQNSLRDVIQRLTFHEENSPLGVIEWDDEFRISRWSPAAEKLFGWSAKEVMGKKFDDWQFVFEEDIEIVQDVFSRSFNCKETQVIARNRNYTKNGSVVHCEWYNSVLCDESGKLISVLSQVLDVTERKQVEAALRESEALFRQMADTSPTLIWMSDTSSLCCYFNQPWLEFTGRTMEQEMGQGWAKGVHPEDSQRCFETYINAFNARQEFRMEYRLKHCDGKYRWILDIGIPRFTSEGIFLGYIGSCIDISDRKQVEVERERMLARSQEYTRQLNGLMEAALAINSALSMEEVIRIITEQAREIIGAHQGFTTMTIDDECANLISWASFSDKYAAWRDQHQHLDGLGIDASIRLINRSVRMTQTELEAHPQWQKFSKQIDNRPPMRGCLAAPLIGRNYHNMGLIQLSDKYQDEFTKEDEAIIVQLAQMASIAIENTRLYEAEQQARTQAEEANCIKDEFLAVLSHELRSPLNPILGWSKLLQSRKFDEKKTVTALATIERNARLQAQLIEDLLDVSRILQGKLTLNVDQVDLEWTISVAMETVRLAAEAKSIQLKFLSDTDSTALVMGDPNRLQQVFWNLLSNAVKFTPPGGRVQICLESIDDNIQIQVMDTGKGIDPKFLSHVFDYFRQADSATTRKFGGLGLGLAIVRQLVELHGGRVFADSAGEGEGATFTVQLPASQTQLITADSHSEGEMDSSLGNLEGIKILVVDDDLDSRDFICFVLEEEGAEVISVSSAIEALQTLPDSKADVLLSDIGMPEMDGYMLMRQVRTWTSEQGGKTPAIALTAYAGEYNQQQAMSAGFQMHVTKPAEPSQLVAAVARLAGKTVISH
ncbi:MULTISPECIES: PAS domain S-box protein [unclassified Nodularia (in: cyanobacteria)]|uniref:PAS domain S-box protein n=1 Tax=unclassified Nodularia (in: cyanobacteria) TaxID=2656917 RepID=UPI001880A013|nr:MULTISPECIES: PAS domain S-box protein [unclassified Nodularia (in: cyanobacteria)]MBE9198788.1 PAS domain S-box protein [Nodularia sp. LEGE 06071]MCC2695124.1 PAS domain S-box protein [Nodularia sp. LEGE 04288]